MTPDQIAETRKKAADAVRRPDTDTEQVLALLLIDIADALEAERARCAEHVRITERVWRDGGHYEDADILGDIAYAIERGEQP